jgi:hypothetical protein
MNAACVARGLCRGLPLLENDTALAGYALRASRLVSMTARFAAASPVRQDDAVRELHAIVHSLNGGLPDKGAPVRQIARAAYALARGVLLATSELTARASDGGAEDDSTDVFARAGDAIRAAARLIGSGLNAAMASGDAYRLSAAEQAERAAAESHRRRRPCGADLLGLPFDASENGPMGPLWPAGAPGWYHDCGHALRTRAQPAAARYSVLAV